VLFYPAAVAKSYPFFLVALFVVGLGFAMLQIAANPYVTILGPEETAPSRLNLSQAFNSFGTTIGPIIGGWLIFTFFTSKDRARGGFGENSLPRIRWRVRAAGRVLQIRPRAQFHQHWENRKRGLGALKHPHTALGMLAIFMYVGGEVSVGSAIINYLGLPKLGGLAHEAASKFLAFYWGGLMIGRFHGRVRVERDAKGDKNIYLSRWFR
jgi:MFS transporter, FHS family, L-fucose permease